MGREGGVEGWRGRDMLWARERCCWLSWLYHYIGHWFVCFGRKSLAEIGL